MVFLSLLIPELDSAAIKTAMIASYQREDEIMQIINRNPKLAITVEKDLLHGKVIAGMLKYEATERATASEVVNVLLASFR